jgi:NAD(P)-dependent dehydrogenase (short-subunit alcohol dehydrogenase family)
MASGGGGDRLRLLRGMGVKAFGRALDVADAGALTAFVQDAHAAMGRLDGVVANASPMASGRGVEEFDTAYKVDLMHTRAAVEAALPLLEKHGAITAISSISGIEDYGFDGVSYGTMKAALLFYIKSLVAACGGKGHPGQCGFPRHGAVSRRHLGQGAAGRPGLFPVERRFQPDGTDGIARGDRECRGVLVQPEGQLCIGRECGGGRNGDDPGAGVRLTPRRGGQS